MRTAICLLALLLTACPTTEEGFGECDDDGDGDTFCAPYDCDDNNAAIHPNAPELCNDIDDDCDGELDPGETLDLDGDGSPTCGDCNDEDENETPGAEEICDGIDNDCDGEIPLDEVDSDLDGHLACVDCQDETPEVAPGLEEVACDDRDTNCDGVLHVDEEDGDGDGFTGCQGDCGPDNDAIYPGADEGCDTIDNDCDGALGPEEADADSDGFALCDGDCDDTLPGVSPGLAEACDGLDTDCNGLVDGTDSAGNPEDSDADGDGSVTCTDCDDNDDTVAPGFAELCDGLDNDCNGFVDGTDPEGSPEDADADGDGTTVCAGDCDDDNDSVGPTATEVCDGLDNDCNGLLDATDASGNPEDTDLDGDGAVSCNDCDDEDATIAPGAPELCDGVDTDCNGLVDGVDTNGDPEDTDNDGDGVSTCGGDCDDDNVGVGPNAAEVCDGLDTDCNGLVDGTDASGDPEDQDLDGDGSTVCGGDCDDSNADAHPFGVDLIDGTDGNCDGVIASDNPVLNGWTEPESALLAALEAECEARGLVAVQYGFEVGMVNTPLIEPGLTFSSDPTGVGAELVYNTSFNSVVPRTGTRFAQTQGPAPALVIEFDTPQTFVAGATQVFGNFLWFDFTVELYWDGTLLDQSGFYATVDPGVETWAMRGVQMTNFLAFDELRVLPPGSEQIVLDDLWICD